MILQVLGAIVTHIGSGSTSEVDSALDVMILLASKYSQEMLPLSSHISGIFTNTFNACLILIVSSSNIL